MTCELTFAAFFVTGLMSSVHCLGMCGGIAGSLNMAGRAGPRSPVQGLAYNLAFNGGRIATYALAGLLAGTVGLGLSNLINLSAWSGALRVLTGVLMIAVGLQLAINWRGLRRLEAQGMRVWRHVAPLTGRLLPARSLPAAGALGLLWGWLPCGLVYTMLLTSASVGDPLVGAGAMASFGAGTLPAMLGIGALAGGVARFAARPRLRQAAGGLLAAFGVWTMAPALGIALPFAQHVH